MRCSSGKRVSVTLTRKQLEAVPDVEPPGSFMALGHFQFHTFPAEPSGARENFVDQGPANPAAAAFRQDVEFFERADGASMLETHERRSVGHPEQALIGTGDQNEAAPRIREDRLNRF